MIEEAVLQKVLGAALRNGGDFAEVFAEDRRASSAALDDGKVEELSSGRDRGAGIRVVVGDTTGYAHTADLTEAGLLAAAEAASAAARGRAAGLRVVDLTRQAVNRPNEVLTPPESVAKAVKVELLQAGRRRSSRRGLVDRAGDRPSYGDSRRRILVANSDGLLAEDDQVKTLFADRSASRAATPDCRPGYESVGHPIGFELFDRYDVEELARDGRTAGAAQAAALARALGPPARRDQERRRRRAVPRGVRPRPRGRPRSRSRRRCSAGKKGEQVASPLVTLVDDGTMGDEWGAIAHRRRGSCRAAQRPHRGRHPHRLHVGLPAGPQGRPPAVGQRPAAELPAPADGADDQHVRARTAPTSPTRSSARPSAACTCAQLGGGQVNTATGDFVFGMTEAYMIENGEITDPLREGNLIGNGPEVLRNIDAVGNDFAMGSRARAARTARACRSATASPRCGSPR